MIISYIVIFILIALDYGLKIFFSSAYALNQVEVIIPGALSFGYIRNTGASFGLFEGQQLLFFFATLIALVSFGYFFSSSNWKTKPVYTLAFVFLISGTLGNAIDRMIYGYVIDYIQIPFLPFAGQTYFNLADSLLIGGIILLMIDIIFLETRRHKKPAAEMSNDETD